MTPPPGGTTQSSFLTEFTAMVLVFEITGPSGETQALEIPNLRKLMKTPSK